MCPSIIAVQMVLLAGGQGEWGPRHSLVSAEVNACACEQSRRRERSQI